MLKSVIIISWPPIENINKENRSTLVFLQIILPIYEPITVLINCKQKIVIRASRKQFGGANLATPGHTECKHAN